MVHQRVDGSVVVCVPEDWRRDVRPVAVLRRLFGDDAAIAVQTLPLSGGKVVQYTSELTGGMGTAERAGPT
jgi:hypothetical protein